MPQNKQITFVSANYSGIELDFTSLNILVLLALYLLEANIYIYDTLS